MTNIKTIRDVASINVGYQLRSKPIPDKHGGTLLIRAKDIKPDRTKLMTANAIRISTERSIEKRLLKDGDVLFMGKGLQPFACPVRNLTEPTLAAGIFFVIRPNQEYILPEYLAWYLNKDEILRTLLIACGTGITMPVIRRGVIEKLQIPLPSLKIQQKICGLLAVANREKYLMDKLITQKQTLIQAVCKKLTDQNEDKEIT